MEKRIGANTPLHPSNDNKKPVEVSPTVIDDSGAALRLLDVLEAVSQSASISKSQAKQ